MELEIEGGQKTKFGLDFQTPLIHPSAAMECSACLLVIVEYYAKSRASTAFGRSLSQVLNTTLISCSKRRGVRRPCVATAQQSDPYSTLSAERGRDYENLNQITRIRSRSTLEASIRIHSTPSAVGGCSGNTNPASQNARQSDGMVLQRNASRHPVTRAARVMCRAPDDTSRRLLQRKSEVVSDSMPILCGCMRRSAAVSDPNSHAWLPRPYCAISLRISGVHCSSI